MDSEPMTDQRSPEQIRRDIEETRADMDQTLDQIEYKVSPTHIRERQTAKVRSRFSEMRSTVRDNVMGSRDYGTSSSGPSTTDQARQKGQEAADTVRDAPDKALAQTRGNPLAAGLIAFGAGAMLGGLMPSTQAEQDAATTLKDKAEEPVKQELSDSAQRSKDDMQPAAQEAADQTKERAQEAAQRTKDDAQSRAQDVEEDASDASDRVRQ